MTRFCNSTFLFPFTTHHMNHHGNPMTAVTIRYAYTLFLSIRDAIPHLTQFPWLIDDGFKRTLVQHNRSELKKCHLRSVWEYPSAVTFHWMSTPRRASTGHTPRMTQVNQHTGLFGATCSGKYVHPFKWKTHFIDEKVKPTRANHKKTWLRCTWLTLHQYIHSYNQRLTWSLISLFKNSCFLWRISWQLA